MIKVLFLASNPIGSGQLDLNKEYATIKEKMAEVYQGNLFEVAKENHVSLGDLEKHLLNYKPHIVHFSGHGDEQGNIIVDRGDHSAVPVPWDALSELFRTLAKYGRGVRCVVLNACFTDRSADAIAESVPCVVGMRNEIRDQSAIEFAAGFYRAIASGCTVEGAVAFGRTQIALTPTAGDPSGTDAHLPRVRAKLVDPKKFIIRDPPAPPNRGKLLHGKYCVVGTQGTGLISRIDIALDVQLERRVVIKTLVEPAAREAFEREARELARVAKHPNIVSVYGAWLYDDPPHYVREYVEGHSLRDELFSDGRAALPIDFVHQVLAALGDAMVFSAQAGVLDLGIEPEKVLIQKKNPRLNLGLPTSYSIVLYPAAGGSEYIRDVLPGRLSERSRLYVPPEYFRNDRLWADVDRANQYRLGILGYEMLIGSESFREQARQRAAAAGETPAWLPIRELDQTCRCPSFLSDAIERMIRLEPADRFESLREAVDVIAHRDLNVEVARDSFIRIVNREGKDGKSFFYTFYTELLSDEGVRRIFPRDRFPDLGPELPTDWKDWRAQFNKLKEAIVFLLAYSLLKETHDPTILTPIAQMHRGFPGIREEHYDHFGETLIKTVLEFDKGNYPNELESAWQHAIRPGLEYLKTKLREANLGRKPNAPDADMPPWASKNGRKVAHRKIPRPTPRGAKRSP